MRGSVIPFLFLSCFLFEVSFSAQIFVATNGSNTEGNGTIQNPYADLLFAYNLANPGDTVYVRGGVYGTPGQSQGYWLQNRNGTADAPITLQNYNGEKVVLDAKINLGNWLSLFLIESVEYITIDGFELRNAVGENACIYAKWGSHITVQNCIIHDCGGTCGQFIGTYYTFLNNEIYNCVLDNAYSNRTGGWAGSFGSGGMQPNGQPSGPFIFRNNYIHNTWGEGLSLPNADGAEVTNCIFENTFSASIYLDHTNNANISNNFIDINNDTYRRGDNGQIAQGIGMSCEYYYSNPAAPWGVWNTVISNNIILRAYVGINYWWDTRNKNSFANYQNLQIINNLVLAPTSGIAFHLDGPPNSTVSIENNIFAAGTAVIYMSPYKGITASNNDYAAGKPGFDTSSSSITSNPLFVNPSGVYNYNGTDLTNALAALQLQSTSPCKYTGTYVSDVLTDFTGAPRHNPPSMGPLEYSPSSSSDTPSSSAPSSSDTPSLSSSSQNPDLQSPANSIQHGPKRRVTIV